MEVLPQLALCVLSQLIIGLVIMSLDVWYTKKCRLTVKPKTRSDWFFFLFVLPLGWPLMLMNANMRILDEDRKSTKVERGGDDSV